MRGHEDDFSLSRDSVLDWGSLPGPSKDRPVGGSTLGSADGRTTSGNTHISRYDPKAMNRITDINDLVDDNSFDSDDDAIVGGGATGMVEMESGKARAGSNFGPGRATRTSLPCRQAIVLLALIGIIAACSLAIGFVFIDTSSSSANAPYSVVEGEDGGDGSRQKLLEMAERVVTACSESKLNQDMTDCQRLCKSSMCCFDSGKYSCQDDESKDCAVYAGCEALVEGVPIDAAEEDQE